MTALSKGARDAQAPPALRLDLDRDPQAPSLARAAVAGFCERGEMDGEQASTLALLVSELVSNAVMHSQAPPASEILLCVCVLDEGGVRVEVIDRGSGFSVIPRDPARSNGGYGLFLVDRQASRWGVDRMGGTRVWFELAA
ncbi:MAG TPA: ATP-binding protein [Solirubrobacteraceae bacterium]|nr:ATP-binding protein [Solirubrobacteraceae bacterium]